MSDPAQTDPATVDLAFAAHPDQPLLPGPEFHTYLRERRAEGPLVPASMMGFPARLITRYHELDAAFRDNEGFPAGPTYATTIKPCQGVTLPPYSPREGADHDRYRTTHLSATGSHAHRCGVGSASGAILRGPRALHVRW